MAAVIVWKQFLMMETLEENAAICFLRLRISFINFLIYSLKLSAIHPLLQSEDCDVDGMRRLGESSKHGSKFLDIVFFSMGWTNVTI